jgi:hypothetical protein
VAFTAAATYHQSWFNEERVIFDNVLSNVGGWYNHITSEFTFPLDGH